MHLVITLPHRQNTIPLVSTQRITKENVTRILLQEPSGEPFDYPAEHVCSNMNTHADTSLLTIKAISQNVVKHQPLNYHLHRTNCEWRFALWMPVRTLLSKCGTQRLPRAINVTIYTAYYHIELEQVIVVSNTNTMTTSIAYIPGTTPFLPVPLHTLAESSAPDDPALIYPIAVENVDHTSEKRVYFYTIFPLWEIGMFPSNVSELQLTLLHTTMTAGYELFTQAWLLESKDENVNFTLELETFHVLDAITTLYEYQLVIMEYLSEYAPYLMTNVRLYTYEEQNSTELKPLEVGKYSFNKHLHILSIRFTFQWFIFI